MQDNTPEIGAEEQLIAGRWRALRQLGGGVESRTMLVEDPSRAGGVAVVKEFALAAAADWKALELFERGAQVLKALEHPQIPAVYEVFREEASGRFYLVQEYAEGVDLRQYLAQRAPFSETEVREFLASMLDILTYMHGFSPPVIHRDIKPSNIIRRPDGSYMLIDFGAVQTIIAGQVGGTTVAGTSGYMPPEQLFGKAAPASDLYALGASAAHLATGVEPWRLPLVRGQLDLSGHPELSAQLRNVLDKLLAPDLDERPESAQAARALLQSDAPNEGALSAPSRRPRAQMLAAYSAAASRDEDIQVKMYGDELHIELYSKPRHPDIFSAIIGALIFAGFYAYAIGDSHIWSILGWAAIGVPAAYSVVWGTMSVLSGDERAKEALIVSTSHIELKRYHDLQIFGRRPLDRVLWRVPREHFMGVDPIKPHIKKASRLLARGAVTGRLNFRLEATQPDISESQKYPICVDLGLTSRARIERTEAQLVEALSILRAHLRDY